MLKVGDQVLDIEGRPLTVTSIRDNHQFEVTDCIGMPFVLSESELLKCTSPEVIRVLISYSNELHKLQELFMNYKIKQEILFKELQKIFKEE